MELQMWFVSVCVHVNIYIGTAYYVYMCVYKVHGFVFSRLLGTFVLRYQHSIACCEKNSLHTAEEKSHYLNCKIFHFTPFSPR